MYTSESLIFIGKEVLSKHINYHCLNRLIIHHEFVYPCGDLHGKLSQLYAPVKFGTQHHTVESVAMVIVICKLYSSYEVYSEVATPSSLR